MSAEAYKVIETEFFDFKGLSFDEEYKETDYAEPNPRIGETAEVNSVAPDNINQYDVSKIYTDIIPDISYRHANKHDIKWKKEPFPHNNHEYESYRSRFHCDEIVIDTPFSYFAR